MERVKFGVPSSPSSNTPRAPPRKICQMLKSQTTFRPASLSKEMLKVLIQCSVFCPKCSTVSGKYERSNLSETVLFTKSSDSKVHLAQLPSRQWEFRCDGNLLCFSEDRGDFTSIEKWILIKKSMFGGGKFKPCFLHIIFVKYEGN